MRGFWIKIHLYVATFFLPMLLAMATSGGLYLLGIKGTVETVPVAISTPVPVSIDSGELESEVQALLASNAIDHQFEYLKVVGTKITTRPTSTVFYELDLGEDPLVLTRNEPDFIKSLVELHKGHGPLRFKDLQKLMAAGLLIVLLSGFWLGISSAPLRLPTLLTTIAGAAAFLYLSQ